MTALLQSETSGMWFKHLALFGLIGGLVFGLALFPLTIIILLIGAVGGGLLCLRWPQAALYLLILAIPFGALLQVSLGGVSVGVSEGLVSLALGSWVLQMLAQRAVIIPHPPFLWPFLLFLGAIAISWLNTFSVAGSLVESVKWLEMLALYLLISATCTKQDALFLSLTMLLSGAIQGLLGVYQFVFQVGPEGFLLFEGRFLRAYGTFQQPNPYAGYLGLSLPLGIALILWLLPQIWAGKQPQIQAYLPANIRRHWRGQQLSIVILGLFCVVCVVAMVAGLFASQSRGGWIGFAVAVSMTVFALGGRWIMALVLAGLSGATALALGGLQILPASITQRFSNAIPYLGAGDISQIKVSDANFSTLERLAHWQAARDMWRDYFWSGVGFGNYEAIYSAYAIGPWQDPLGHAHNYILNLGAETGYIGLLGYTIFWIWVLGVCLYQVWKNATHQLERAILAGSLGIMAHLHTHNMLDNLYVQGMYLHVAIIIGLITLVSHKEALSCQH